MLQRIIGFLLVLSCLNACKTTPSNETGLLQTDTDNGSELYELFKEHSAARSDSMRSQIEAKLFGRVHELQQTSVLKQAILGLFAIMESKGNVTLLKEMPAGSKQDLAAQLSEALLAERAKRKAGSGYKGWEAYSKDLLSRANINVPSGNPWESDAFLNALQGLSKTKFYSYDSANVLASGPQSFSKRDELMDDAQDRIWILSWAFYDDFTGNEAADRLIKLKNKNANLDIRVVVDGMTGLRSFSKGVLAKMRNAGIEVMLWRSKSQPFNGMHRKFMVIDNKHVLGGGMNFGNEYSHRGVSDSKHKWKDTDMYIQSAGMTSAAAEIFSKSWNKYVSDFPDSELTKVKAESATSSSASTGVMLVDHDPSVDMSDPIYTLTLAAINGAKKNVLVSNAYYIATPAIETALVNAAKRGVEVVLHTNSKDSVDVPQLIRPIYRGLPNLANAGVKLYLHSGTTVHSKYMVIDEQFGWVGSYNFHPRSFLYESESVLAFVDSKLGQKLSNQFYKDLDDTIQVKDVSEVSLPDSTISDFAERFFFDQL